MERARQNRFDRHFPAAHGQTAGHREKLEPHPKAGREFVENRGWFHSWILVSNQAEALENAKKRLEDLAMEILYIDEVLTFHCHDHRIPCGIFSCSLLTSWLASFCNFTHVCFGGWTTNDHALNGSPLLGETEIQFRAKLRSDKAKEQAVSFGVFPRTANMKPLQQKHVPAGESEAERRKHKRLETIRRKTLCWMMTVGVMDFPQN